MITIDKSNCICEKLQFIKHLFKIRSNREIVGKKKKRFVQHRCSRATLSCTAWLIDLRVENIEIDRLLCHAFDVPVTVCLNDSLLFLFFRFQFFFFAKQWTMSWYAILMVSDRSHQSKAEKKSTFQFHLDVHRIIFPYLYLVIFSYKYSEWWRVFGCLQTSSTSMVWYSIEAISNETISIMRSYPMKLWDSIAICRRKKRFVSQMNNTWDILIRDNILMNSFTLNIRRKICSTSTNVN